MTLEILRGFKVGSTRPTMFFLAVASMIQAAQFLLASSPLLAGRKYAMSSVAHPDFWAYAHIVLAMLVLWRLVDTVPRLYAAWTINACMFGLWVATYIAPAVATGDGWALLSLVVLFPAMAVWSLVRTEATLRDKLTA